MINFSEIKFGEISAEAEREINPELIEHGFVDLQSIEKEALSGRRFLFLGYKGSGKSSIGERIDISKKNMHDRFVTKVSLGDFPFTPFSKIVKGDIEPEAKFPTAWSWIILIYIMESFGRDAAMYHPRMNDFQATLNLLKQLGVSPDVSPAAIVRSSSKNKFSLKIPFDILGYESESSPPKSRDQIFNFVNSLKEFIVHIRSPNKHFLIIDGLDEILSSRGVQYKSLYALINECLEINTILNKNSVPFKIIVLCRTDLFDRVPGPNKNKIRNPYAFELDWYHDPNEPDSSMLIRGANLRASIGIDEDVDIFKEFFPSYINQAPTRQYLLDMTRHTPRDFFQLLACIQKYHKSGRMTKVEIISGLRDYSNKYFQPEIHDELSGYADVQEIFSIFSAISVIGKRDFSFDELATAWFDEIGAEKSEVLTDICKAMFDCSAIGNVEHTYYTFKYRNRFSSFSANKRIMLHRGLLKAMNIGAPRKMG